MNKKQVFSKNKYRHLTYLISGLLVAFVFVAAGYYAGSNTNNKPESPVENKTGYIISQQAKEQVNNFYQQYINDYSNPAIRSKIISAYGSSNLIFYNEYYQHGFNPITCSSLAPSAITISSVTPGTEATVYVKVAYVDNSSAVLKVTVLINNEGIRLDSITCPGDKANLPPLNPSL